MKFQYNWWIISCVLLGAISHEITSLAGISMELFSYSVHSVHSSVNIRSWFYWADYEIFFLFSPSFVTVTHPPCLKRRLCCCVVVLIVVIRACNTWGGICIHLATVHWFILFCFFFNFILCLYVRLVSARIV